MPSEAQPRKVTSFCVFLYMFFFLIKTFLYMIMFSLIVFFLHRASILIEHHNALIGGIVLNDNTGRSAGN